MNRIMVKYHDVRKYLEVSCAEAPGMPTIVNAIEKKQHY